MGSKTSTHYIRLEKAIEDNNLQELVRLYKNRGDRVRVYNIHNLNLDIHFFKIKDKREFVTEILRTQPEIYIWFLILIEKYVSEETLVYLYQRKKISLKTLEYLHTMGKFGKDPKYIRCIVNIGVSAYSLDWERLKWNMPHIGFEDFLKFRKEMYDITDTKKLKTNFAILLENNKDHPLMQRKDMFYALCQVAGV